MKVWELMAKLSVAKANAEVLVQMESTENSRIVHVSDADCANVVSITGGDAQLLDNEGNEAGLLSELAVVDEE